MTARYDDQDEAFEDLDETVLDDPQEPDDLTNDADWDEETTPPGDMESEIKKPKKGGMFNVILIGLGILVFFSFLYFKMSAPPVSTPLAPPEEMVTPLPVPEPAVADIPSNPPAPVLPEMPEQPLETAPNLPPPLTLEMPPAPVLEPITTPDMNPSQSPVIPTPLESAPVLVPTPDPETAGVPSNTTPASPPPVAETDTRFTALATEIESLKTAISQKDKSDTEMADVLSRLTILSERLDRLERTRPVQIQESTNTHNTQTQSQPEAPESALSTESGVPAAPYTLKAVSQGRAYLVRTGQGNNFISVQVGDQVKGLGRIRSIKQVNGRWVVAGTEGTVRQ